MFGLGLVKIVPYVVYGLALMAILVSLFEPKIGFFFLISLLPFRILLVKIYPLPLGEDINDLLFISVFIGMVWHVRDEEGRIFSYNPLNKYAISLVIFSFFSLLAGSIFWGIGNILYDPRLATWKNFALLPVLYLMTVNLIKSKRDIFIVVLIMAIALFWANYFFYSSVKYKSLLSFREDIRAGYIFPNLGPNEFAAFITHFVFLPITLIFYERYWPLKSFYVILILLSFYTIFFLFSRGAYVALILGLLYFGIRKSKLVVMGLIVLLFVWNTLLPSAVVERVNMTRVEEEILDHSSSSRLEYWSLGLKQFARSPIIGVGFDTSKIFRGGDLHNVYVEILAEQGVIGLWIFLMLLYKTFSNGVVLHKKAKDNFLKGLGLAVTCVVISCAITNLFGDRWTYMELSAFMFILMGLVVSSLNFVERETAEIVHCPSH